MEGTPVQMADGTTKPIEDINEGDLVLSRDQNAGIDGKTVGARVTRTFVHQVDHTIVLTLSSGERIQCTDNHPFYVPGCGWVPAGRLALGTQITPRAGPRASGSLLALGVVTVANVERRAADAKTGATTVYNFEVEGTHTYFVGKSGGGVWVHNACPFILGLGTTIGEGGSNPLGNLLSSLWSSTMASGSQTIVRGLIGEWSLGNLAQQASQAQSIHFTTEGIENWGSFTQSEMEWILNNSQVWEKTYIH